MVFQHAICLHSCERSNRSHLEVGKFFFPFLSKRRHTFHGQRSLKHCWVFCPVAAPHRAPETLMQSCTASWTLPSATPSPLGVIPASFCSSVGSLSLFRTGPPALPLGTPGAGNERDRTPSHTLAQEEGVTDLDLVRKRTLRFSDLHCIQRNCSFYSLFLPFVAGSFAFS